VHSIAAHQIGGYALFSISDQIELLFGQFYEL
jgi:hypothetical protein